MTPLSPVQKTFVGIQFLFVAFGSTVIMPLLVGLDPATALFSAGVGTLIFHAVTRGMVPIYLGSSFAYVTPIIFASREYGLAATLSGFIGVAVIYLIVSALVWARGMLSLFPVIIGIIVGYAAAAIIGAIDFAPVVTAPWIAVPTNIANPQMPRFEWQPIILRCFASQQ